MKLSVEKVPVIDTHEHIDNVYRRRALDGYQRKNIPPGRTAAR